MLFIEEKVSRNQAENCKRNPQLREGVRREWAPLHPCKKMAENDDKSAI